jgi:hypothetical protein
MSNVAAIGLDLVVLGTWIRLMAYLHLNLGRFFRFGASIQELIVSVHILSFVIQVTHWQAVFDIYWTVHLASE